MSANETPSVLLVGSGIAGLCTALALGKRGLSVTVLERDEPPPAGEPDRAFFEWPRRGATQFRHPHAFLGLMCNLLEENYPDLLDAFYAAGARRVEFKDMLSAELAPKYEAQPGDEKLWVLMCRRAIIETVLRRYVGAMPNVEFRNGVHVDDILLEERNGRQVATGVRLRRDCVERFGETIEADIVIDGCGRTTKFPRWLARRGINVREENDDAEIVYYTRHYRLKPGVEEPPRTAKDRAAGDLGYLKFGVFPGDNRHFAIIVCVHKAETTLHEAVTNGDQFDRICQSIPGLQPWLRPDTYEPTTDAFGIGDIRAIWRHFVEDGEPLLENFFAVGDAALRTNPLYGRGCSTGILHAHLLADTLTEMTDPRERALSFHARTEEQLRPIFKASLTEDRNGIRRALAQLEGELVDTASGDSLKQRFGLAFGDALMAAARYNLHVNRGMMRTVNLLEKPGEFLKDWRTQAIIYGYMLRGRARNAGARIVRGPSRDEMLDLLRVSA